MWTAENFVPGCIVQLKSMNTAKHFFKVETVRPIYLVLKPMNARGHVGARRFVPYSGPSITARFSEVARIITWERSDGA